MKLIDIGANLTNKAFRADLPGVLARARAAGVAPIVVTGTSIEASRAAWELSEAHPGLLYATAGVHPHHASRFGPSDVGELTRLAARKQVVALGECGLDFNRKLASQKDQLRCFEAQLELAGSLGRPLFLHERDAHSDFVALLERHRPRLGQGVVHCFTGGERELSRYLELDLHIGITGWICDERRGTHLKALVRSIPSSRLMIETDAPYLLPRDLKPPTSDRRNEPAFLPHILLRVAACRDEDPSALAQEIEKTTRAFFGI
jgi:TatD DNase family protein